MILKRFYDERLAQASYLIGCAATGEALVIDPNRDIDQYLQAAVEEKVRISAVTETHIHADLVSGSRELAARSGATLFLSDEGGADWRYTFSDAPNVTLLMDGDVIRIGNLRFEVLHTPGHTPEHLSFRLTDHAAGDDPIGVFTGDFVFVGDVGRPDLLERAAKQIGSMERGARQLFHSLQSFKSSPDYLQIWPGHGAGSACGKSLSGVPQSTVGYERRTNWAFRISEEDRFVESVLEGQPEPPTYFARMKRVNKEGAPILGDVALPGRLPSQALSEVLERGAIAVDIRPAAEFAARHIPGTVNIPFDRSFTNWAGWLVSPDRPLYLVADERCASCLADVTRELTKIGIDRVIGYFSLETFDAWRGQGRPLGVIRQVDVIPRPEDSVKIVDVRARSEWDAGHLPSALHIPLGYLVERLGDLPRDQPVIVYCQSGARSAIAASLLLAHGFSNVGNLSGGYAAVASAAGARLS